MVRWICLTLLAPTVLSAQEVKRPRITGVAHIALFSRDVAQSRGFYTGLLGYEEPFDLKQPDGSLALTFFKINERQYIELFPERAPGSDRLAHIALETDDAEGMRRYLASKGIQVPEKVPKGRTGNSNFTVRDPDGHGVEFVQYEPSGWTAREGGRSLGAGRVSESMIHVGILVGAVEPAMRFYREILGFRETWRGSRDAKELNWINMQVPDGADYIEFMLYRELPPPDKRGTAHHLCLVVPDLAKALEQLEARAARKDYARPIEGRVGINRRRQANLYDPDGTRAELMEPATVDGTPAPSSTAPPPR